MIRHYKKIIFVAIIIIGLFLWQLYQKVFSAKENFSGRPGGEASVAVEVKPIQEMTIDDEGLFTGTLLPRAQFIVAPKLIGRVKKIFVNIGDPVKYGQLIAQIDDDEYLQQVERAQAELDVAIASVEEARSAFEVAKRDYERVIALRDKKIASEAELDAAKAKNTQQEAKYKVALAQVTQKEASLREAKVRLSYTKIKATWEENNLKNSYRFVGERFVYEGALVNTNTPIVTILDINTTIGVIYVIERDYPKIKVGMKAEITTDAYPLKKFEGGIVRIAPMLKESSREARIEIEIPNPDNTLKPGMFIRAKIVYSTENNAVVVPVNSLANRDEKEGIFLADTTQMRVSFIPIKRGITNNEYTEIVEPPLSGLVVIMGQHLLEDGSSIIIPGFRTEGTKKQIGGNKPSSQKNKGDRIGEKQ
jgi:RND family efflux transporter MFP subunit